jgi:hypothetical protein
MAPNFQNHDVTSIRIFLSWKNKFNSWRSMKFSRRSVFRTPPYRGELAGPLLPRCRRDCRRLELHATPVVHGYRDRQDDGTRQRLLRSSRVRILAVTFWSPLSWNRGAALPNDRESHVASLALGCTGDDSAEEEPERTSSRRGTVAQALAAVSRARRC